MNFLAHFHLAWPDQGMIVGGLEGDYIKGPLTGSLLPDIERGVKLHRAIDAYTDAHPLIGQLRRELPPGLRRYAGIIIDLSFDHFLSLNWSRYSDVPLREFNAGVYTALSDHETELSAAARGMAARLAEHDILNLYRDWDTVTASARRIGQRFRRHNPFLDIDRDLAPKKALIEEAFLNFYPDLQSFCEAWDEPV
jgi:acyl carrier protein phosphodiesterase